jgi:NAD(P)-dependent dehydrogenase (short-subunit alcohol dehydrogenase family)
MKRILVLGSSDGIGLATTRSLLAEGWEVTGLSRSPSPVDNARYHHETLDVSSPALRDALESLKSSRGPFDACIYCAGNLELADVSDLRNQTRVFTVNLMGALVAAEALIPPMAEAGAGHFLVLSSMADGIISREVPSYTASKAALSSYFEGLALALKPRGVAVTNIRLGFVDTKLAKAATSRPFMMTADKAAAIVLGALKKRPIRVSRPLPMELLTRVHGWVSGLRTLLS